MIKELKYFFFIFTIFLFLFFIGRYYFSDQNKKESYRSINQLNEKIDNFSKNLVILKSDTENIIEYAENVTNKEKKKYHFWQLILNND
jgi:cbb3-type cytochrome oxidase subunit 3